MSLTFSDVNIQLPQTPLWSNVELKKFEDAIDALVCAWVGVQYVNRKCTPYGDASGAIWTP